MTQEKKKKLTLLPEVLPDPRPARIPSSSPRARTFAHMQRLVATAAAVGVASVSCGKEAIPKTETQRGCSNPLKEPESKVDTPDANFGYAVVDPVPTPAFCPGIAPLVAGAAKFHPHDGMFDVTITLPLPTGRADFKYVKDAAPVAFGGTVVGTEQTANGVVVRLRLDPAVAASKAGSSTHSLGVSVKGMCNYGPTTLMASVTWMGPVRTASPMVVISEY